jgi:Family of unknown function (DUF6166)
MYTGKIVNDDVEGISDVDRVIDHDGKVLSLDASLKIVNHSPTGFNWGYEGSGPAQLALAICLEHLNGDKQYALAVYQEFKSMVISKLDMDKDFQLDDKVVENAITTINVRHMQRA